MGGQACVLFGAAEFSRDLDLTIAVDAANLQRVRGALQELNAETVFVPDLSEEALQRGHACHFRCRAAGVEELRIDVMNRMRGCPDFDTLWERRAIVEIPEIGALPVLSLPDLVRAKKTQRDKDWPMIRRLIETDIAERIESTDSVSNAPRVEFWFQECRTPSLLIELAKRFPDICEVQVHRRPLLAWAWEPNLTGLENALAQEEREERQKDTQYWTPLKKELEQWRHERRRESAD